MEQDSLFSEQVSFENPLADRMRPKKFEDFVGQKHFVNDRFKRLLETDKWVSFIFWGPPGTGKTSLARLIADTTKRPFRLLSAVTAGVKEIRAVLEESQASVRSGLPAYILFIDEVHRLNRAQQDVLLPYLESGVTRFIGATTENPSFEINNAIASRSLVFHFEPLEKASVQQVLKRSVPSEKTIEEKVLERIAVLSLGDARRALNILENVALTTAGEETITEKHLEEVCHSQSMYYDKKSEAHYDTISAFIKSLRGSDPDASVYYLARMLEGGEDPLFIARRLIIFSSEDIGNANPMALVLAQSAFEAVHKVGMPEARIILGQAVTYLACSEKSNRSYEAIEAAIAKVKETGPLEIPLHIRNAPTRAMKEWGYGKGYQYPHKFEGGWVKENYLPKELSEEKFYNPSDRGVEKRFQETLKSRSEKDSHTS